MVINSERESLFLDLDVRSRREKMRFLSTNGATQNVYFMSLVYTANTIATGLGNQLHVLECHTM